VVDDHPDTLEVLCLVLGTCGLRAEGYPDGRSAWAALESVRPDLLLTDLRLGDESGADLARRVAADPRFSSMSVVGITGDVVEQRQQDGSGRFDRVLAKPIDPFELVEVLRSTHAERLARAR
jgi:CheY-like chemotaxis protein